MDRLRQLEDETQRDKVRNSEPDFKSSSKLLVLASEAIFPVFSVLGRAVVFENTCGNVGVVL